MIRFAILLFRGFPLMAFSSLIEPLRAANILAGRPCYSWITVGPGEERIVSSSRIGVEPDFPARTAPLVDRIVVCSGGDADQIVANDAIAWIRKNLRAGASIGAVADAAFFLARSGLLDGFSCTLHWTSQPAFQEQFPGLDMRREPYVIDRSRFTSAGGIASLDMMLEMISADYGPALAADIADWYHHSRLRSDTDRHMLQLRLRTGIRDGLVLSAVAAMESAVEERLPIADIARQLSISLDKLERHFQREVKTSPSAYYRALRLRHAAHLLTHSTRPIGEVALICGFENTSSFARSFRGHFGYPPGEIRRRKSIAGEVPRI